MTFWNRLLGRQPASPEPSTPATPELIVMLGLRNSRFFFEERLVDGSDEHWADSLQEMAGKLLEIDKIIEIRTYPYYIAVSHQPVAEDVIMEVTLAILGDHFNWSEPVRINHIFDTDEVHVLDDQKHPGQPKWRLGVELYRTYYKPRD